MLKIGLTGGIGTGKTTVAELFEAHNIPVLDADQIAHSLVAPQKPALQAIVAHFGDQILTPEGRLDRAQLRTLIFTSEKQKQALETILHPLIYQAMQDQVNHIQTPYCILSIPLLIETGKQSFVDRILVVECSPDLQQARVKRRDNLSAREITKIMSAQTSMEEKRHHADDLIQNNTDRMQLKQQVDKLHQLYLSLSNHKSNQQQMR